jgi:hypothetical protein
MGAAKKLEMAPDEVFLQEALKSGRAKLVHDLSMKALGKPDVAFQARDIDTPKGLNMDHVKRLDLIYQLEKKLAPVVVFMAIVGKVVRMILADGFHRHEVYRLAKADSIRAYVFDVPMDQLEHRARLFAAMCNQVTLLDRTDADKRKAVEMLFADPECWEWADRRIASHCGVSPGVVAKYRALHASSEQLELPESVIRRDGTRYHRKDPMRVPCQQHSNSLQFSKQIDGKVVNLGTTEEAAKAKLAEIMSANQGKRRVLGGNHIVYFMSRKGFGFTSCLGPGHQGKRLPGFYGHGVIYVITEFKGDRDCGFAVGSLVLLRRKMALPGARLVVLCYAEDGPQELIEIAKLEGIEFLTPEQLVESLMGRKGEGEGT